ncbi:NAD(P)H-hydrate epimerase [Haloarchaeobius sp. HRN-SO-5]|uniref:NAD(P)H-hydrate epimerase n=1 Tax=Haloarchaeobius sp. HRN-SO-5 TaxID=3446118 RepID=UPI003EBC02ED
MRDVDRVAVDDVGLQLLQMMENAGRALAWHVRDVRESDVFVVAGNGGNGGGGLVCARHLANRDVSVQVVLDRPAEELTGAAAHQHRILDEMGVPVTTEMESLSQRTSRFVVVDALIGYGLSGEVRPPASSYIDTVNRRPDPVVSLDVPSGIDATTGEALGNAVTPDRTVTLALPKTGLDEDAGTIFLADIGVPKTVYDRLGIEYDCPFGDSDWVRLEH